MIGFQERDGGGKYDSDCARHREWWGRMRLRSDTYEYGFNDGTRGVYRPFDVFCVARSDYERGNMDGMVFALDPTSTFRRTCDTDPEECPWFHETPTDSASRT